MNSTLRSTVVGSLNSIIRNHLCYILSWNIRVINDLAKWPHVRRKIEESKRTSFDHAFVRCFCSKRFDKYAFVPSGGLLILWSSRTFDGQVLLQDYCGLVVSFGSLLFSWQIFTVLVLVKLERTL